MKVVKYLSQRFAEPATDKTSCMKGCLVQLFPQIAECNHAFMQSMWKLKCVPHVQHDYFSSFNQWYSYVVSLLISLFCVVLVAVAVDVA